MKTRILATGLVAMMGVPAFAGSLQDPVAEPPAPAIPAPAPALPVSGDWTGGYAGVQLGWGDVTTSIGADGDDVLYGVHAGYQYDFGTFVLGGEVDYDFAEIDLNGAAEVDSVARLKLRAGYDFGRTLGWFTAGIAEVDT